MLIFCKIYFFKFFLHLCTDIFVEITMITMGHHTIALIAFDWTKIRCMIDWLKIDYRFIEYR